MKNNRTFPTIELILRPDLRNSVVIVKLKSGKTAVIPLLSSKEITKLYPQKGS